MHNLSVSHARFQRNQCTKRTVYVHSRCGICKLVKQFKSERDIYIKEMGTQWNDTERLFTAADGRPMHVNTPYTWLKKLCEKNNFPFYGIHTFRHFFASAEIEAGVDPVTVAAVLGHSTPQTTLSTYSHYFQEARVKVRNVIADVLMDNNEQKTAV